MRKRLALFFALLASGLSAFAQSSLHSAAEGLEPGWSLYAWGDLKVAAAGKPGESVIKVDVTPTVQAWSGFTLSPGWNQSAGAMMPLEPNEVATGALLMEVNGGADVSGAIQGGQQIQFAVALADATGTEIKGTNGYIPFDRVSNATAIDENPATWQQIRVPFARAAGASAALVKGVKKVSIQVVGGGAPEAGFLVRNIRLESAGAAPAAPPPPA
ncbi:MAG: hypothetical protein H7067_11915, partial [Burkholderiales bacterium]|nr:hypothetical protein [Opitutaceae bacterium]